MARSYFKQEHDLGMCSIDRHILDFVCLSMCRVLAIFEPSLSSRVDIKY